MKKEILILLFLVSTVSFAQTNVIAGNYEARYKSSNGLIIDKLILNSDGTFTFHEYDKLDGSVPPERNKYAKGTWKVDKKLILFTAIKSDFDEKFTLNFNKTKARFITKSPRDKSNRNIKTSMRFYESEIFWVTGRTLIKVE